jgi:hypothetical protein
MITDDEIKALRREAMLQVAICDIALGFDGDFYEETLASEIRRELETRGIIPEHVGAGALAREACEQAVRS